MNRRVKKVVLAMAAAGLMASGYAFGAPHNVTTSLNCDEAHTGVTIEQNLVVGPGDVCTLNGTVTIDGNVAITGGLLRICGTTNVAGNVSVNSFFDGGEFIAPGGLAVGCEGVGSATLNINPTELNRGSGNLSCYFAVLGSETGLGATAVNAHGNVSVIECGLFSIVDEVIDVVNTYTVEGPNGKEQKGNLYCFENFDPSFDHTGTIEGAESGDGSCLVPAP